MQTETVQHAFVNRELSDNLFVPRAFKRVQQLRLDEVYPYNPDIVNLNSKIRDYMSNHYHENVSYLDTLGHPKTREYFAQIYKVSPEDVCIAPTISLARWYLTTLFLDDEDSISCNAGLSPEYEKIRLECKYSVKNLSEFDSTKVVAIRDPDIEGPKESNSKGFPTRDVLNALKALTPQQILVWEDPFALLPSNLSSKSGNYHNLPDDSPAYLLTSLTEVILNEASSYAVIILLNNRAGKFNHLTSALLNIASYYFPPPSALHCLTADLLTLVSSEEVDANFQKLEARKQKIAALLAEHGIKADHTPPGVWQVGLPKEGALADLIAKNRIVLPAAEYYRTSQFVYVSILHSDNKFQELISLLQSTKA